MTEIIADKPTIAELERFLSPMPLDEEFTKAANELLAFMDALPEYVPTTGDKIRARMKSIRSKVFCAAFCVLEELARKVRRST